MEASSGLEIRSLIEGGVIAAQSIGEPCTQLTTGTFHIGGTATGKAIESYLEIKTSGAIKYGDALLTVKSRAGKLIVLSRNGELYVTDDRGREREKYAIPYGATLLVR